VRLAMLKIVQSRHVGNIHLTFMYITSRMKFMLRFPCRTCTSLINLPNPKSANRPMRDSSPRKIRSGQITQDTNYPPQRLAAIQGLSSFKCGNRSIDRFTTLRPWQTLHLPFPTKNNQPPQPPPSIRSEVL
jgi:hypothetical protein